MTFVDELPDMRTCALCRKEGLRYDQDLEEYFLFRFTEIDYAHAVCLFHRFGAESLMMIPVYAWKDYVVRLVEQKRHVAKDKLNELLESYRDAGAAA